MDKISLNPAALSKWHSATEAKAPAGVVPGDKAEGKSFMKLLTESLQEANQTQADSDETVARFLSGKGGLHETMIALEKADVSLRLVVQVRNKAVEAYREIMRMQV